MGSLSQPPFTRIAIVGLGLIGGSVALAVKRRWPSIAIAAVDRPRVIATALDTRIIDEGGEELGIVSGADLVMLAAPVLQNVDALHRLPEHTSRALVTDTGSTKRAILEAAASLPAGLEFIGGHPLAGAAAGGVEAARPDLFDDRPWLLTPGPSASETAQQTMSEFVRELRAVPQLIDAEQHDQLLAYLSHLPQLTVSALMHVVGGHAGPNGLVLAGRGLRDTTRLASSPASPWLDIVETNADNIGDAIDALIAALQELRAAPPTPESGQRLEQMFVSAARWKGVLEHS
jgi:prephenate dehydrogenase